MKLSRIILQFIIICAPFFVKGQSNVFQNQIDSLNKKILAIEEPNDVKARLISTLASIYSKQENYTEAKKQNLKALEIFTSLDDNRNSCKVLLDLAMNYDKANQFHQAIEYSYKALDLLDLFKSDIPEKEYNFRRGMILMNTGIINGQIDNYTQSLELLTEANNLLISSDMFYRVVCYGNLGNVHSELKNYEEALLYFNKALDYHLNNEVEPMLISNTLNNIGGIHIATKEYEKALKEFKKALSYIDNEVIYVNEKTGVLNSIGDVYIELDSLDKALEYLDKSINLSKGEGGQRFIENNYKSRVKLHLKEGDYKLAFQNLNTLKKIEDSLYGPVLLKKIERIKSDYDLKVEQRDNLSKIQLLERDNKINLIQRYALIGVIILILWIAFLIYKKQKQKSKLKNIELKNIELEKSQLFNKLEYKNNQLTNYAFYIVKKNEFLDTIKTEIDELKSEGNNEINSLSKIVNQHIIASQDRKDFEIRVKDENKDFYYKLDSKFPGLSDKNKNLCSLLLLELSSKEISSLLNISVESVEKSRYRLRKKLDIPKDTNMSAFLNKL